MPAYRHAVLVWEDYDNGWTASLVEDSDIAACAETAPAAVGQVSDYLKWQSRQQPWLAEPDLFDPQLVHIKVQLRPEYQASEMYHDRARLRTYAIEELVTVRFACVHGRDRNGLMVCVIPTLAERFTYDDKGSLKGLAVHHIQRALRGMTPQQLSRRLPPRSVQLEEIVVQVPRTERSRERKLELPTLNSVAEPLGLRGFRKQLSRPWERDAQVTRLVQTLTKEKQNIVLLGESGAGKTAVIAEAARKVERGKPANPVNPVNPDPAEASARVDHLFWMTGAGRLIAGMQYLGQWQARCESVVDELSQINGVLCVENLLDLVKAGGIGPGDSLAAFMIPYLQRGELRMVAEATPAEFDACRRLLPGLAEVFQVLPVPNFNRQEAVAALQQIAWAQERNLGKKTEAGVVELIYRMFNRFMPYHGFPGKATAFLNDLFDRACLEKAPEVSLQQTLDQLARQTGLPQEFLRDDLLLHREDVLEKLRAQVIGQDAACRAAADLVMLFKAGLNDPNRPLGVLLFCGPTGVGKTELAKALSQFFFGHGDNKDRMLRLDMSEYAGPGAIERLMGAQHGEPSALIRRIRQQPFCVLLLDEIEKAATDVYDLLLGIFDEGRLTDPYGRLTTFRSTIIIMTSNLGADRVDPIGLGKPPPPEYDAEALDFFRPEFFNRIDAIVNFEPLTFETMLRITRKELQDISAREGLARAGLRLKWTDEVVRLLATTGYDRRYGARPLQRALEQRVLAPLARFLIEHPQPRGREITMIDSGGAIEFRV